MSDQKDRLVTSEQCTKGRESESERKVRLVAEELRRQHDQGTWENFTDSAARILAVIEPDELEARTHLHAGGRAGRPLPTRSKRCPMRVRHAPHAARWHNDIETFCDGLGSQ